METKIAIGDVVVLKSGGPQMTVNGQGAARECVRGVTMPHPAQSAL